MQRDSRLGLDRDEQRIGRRQRPRPDVLRRRTMRRMPLVPIPIRFENILTSPTLEPTPLLVGVEEDLQFFNRLRRRAETQQSGVIAFPLGELGDGKTFCRLRGVSSSSGSVRPGVCASRDSAGAGCRGITASVNVSRSPRSTSKLPSDATSNSTT
jgi:hypothetical protein